MTIEQRFKYAGLSFYLGLAGTILLTNWGRKLFEGLQDRTDFYQVVTTLVGLGLVLFTSESIGYLLNSICIFIWNLFGGYSSEWKKLGFDFKKELIRFYDAMNNTEIEQHSKKNMKVTWKNYNSDVFLSYFWQQAPNSLVQWVSRRHTVFFSNITSAFSTALALVLSTILIIGFNLGWTTGTIIVFLVFIVLGLFFYQNAQLGRTEAWQMIDIWMRTSFDPKMGRAIHNIEEVISSLKIEKIITSKPLFKVMRANDVITRNSKDNNRQYYFDNDVDIVSTTISKKYVEPSHLHTSNTESYYIVSGSLLLSVEGQSILLNEGDVAVVSPGACHHFETSGKEVKFLAIKKEPGLKDKITC